MYLNTEKVKNYLKTVDPDTKVLLYAKDYIFGDFYYSVEGLLYYEKLEVATLNLELHSGKEYTTVAELGDTLRCISTEEFALVVENRVENELEEPEFLCEVVSNDFEGKTLLIGIE